MTPRCTPSPDRCRVLPGRSRWRRQLPQNSRLRRPLADCLAACAEHSPHGLLVHIWSADPKSRFSGDQVRGILIGIPGF
jgi:hypothetical protein